MRSGLLASIALTLIACEEPPWEPPGEVVFEGDFLDFRVTADAPEYCGGVPTYLDRYTGALYSELQVEPSGDLVVYSLANPDEVRAYEPEGRHYLAFDAEGGILSGSPVLEHECCLPRSRTRASSPLRKHVSPLLMS